MMRINGRCALGATLGTALSLWVLIVLVTVRKHSTELPISGGLPSETVDSIAAPSIAILLQRSPVEQAEQATRLLAIDRGWAGWGADATPLAFNVQVFASIGISDTNTLHQLDETKHVRPILVREENPMVRLVDGMLSVLGRPGQAVHWLVLANDHSFFLVPNLSCFLSRLDYNDLIYTGNQLAIKMADGMLVFASGGGGCVLSVSAVKALLFTWAVIDTNSITRALTVAMDTKEFSSGDRKSVEMRNKWEAYRNKCGPGLSFRLVDGALFFQKSLEMFQHKFSSLCLNGDDLLLSIELFIAILEKFDSFTLTLPVSCRLSLRIDQNMKGNRTIYISRTSSNYVSVDESFIQRKCIDSSKWGLDNPGIVAAKCLQRIFNVSIPETTSSSRKNSFKSEVGETKGSLWEEKFHVYGPIRTAVYDTDDWYNKMKVLVYGEQQEAAAYRGLVGNNSPVSTISFHYVAHVESELLYRIFKRMFSKKIPRSIRTDELENLLLGNSMAVSFTDTNIYLSHDSAVDRKYHDENTKLVYDHWPKKGLGGYGRKLKSMEEAKLLYDLLFRKITSS